MIFKPQDLNVEQNLRHSTKNIQSLHVILSSEVSRSGVPGMKLHHRMQAVISSSPSTKIHMFVGRPLNRPFYAE